jgi:hypothetical protein
MGGYCITRAIPEGYLASNHDSDFGGNEGTSYGEMGVMGGCESSPSILASEPSAVFDCECRRVSGYGPQSVHETPSSHTLKATKKGKWAFLLGDLQSVI